MNDTARVDFQDLLLLGMEVLVSVGRSGNDGLSSESCEQKSNCLSMHDEEKPC